MDRSLTYKSRRKGPEGSPLSTPVWCFLFFRSHFTWGGLFVKHHKLRQLSLLDEDKRE